MTKRVLLVTPVSPHEPWGGSAQRTRRLLAALARCSEPEVLVLAFHYARGDPACVESRFEGIRVMHLDLPIGLRFGPPHFDLPSRAVTREVGRHADLGAYDVIVSRYVKPAAKLHLPRHVPVVVDFDDALYSPPWRTLGTPRAWLGAAVRAANDRVVLPLRLKHGPLAGAHYFFCRETERAAYPWLNASLLPNLPAPTAAAPDFAPPPRPGLLFVGLLDYPPNRDGVEWFLAEVWPRVRAQVPGARFLIAGKGPAGLLERWAAHPGVAAPGFVERLDEAYAGASAAVVPLRSGGGTSIKALEAYFHGRAVVATGRVVAAHRPLLVPDEHVLVADTAAAFAAQCVRVLCDPALAAGLAATGHARLAAGLSPASFDATVAAAVDAAGGERRPAARQAAPYFSLVVPTLGRTDEVARLLGSLARSTCQDFECIVVDQNPDDRLDAVLAPFTGLFPLRHLRVDFRGAARARNFGAHHAIGQVLNFPDDDCELMPELLAEVRARLERQPLAVLIGMCVDRDGAPSTTRFALDQRSLTAWSMWNRNIEFTMFFDRTTFVRAGGFDERFGPGAEFGSDEGVDLLIRMLRLLPPGAIRYDHRLRFFHPNKAADWSSDGAGRARSYARGSGALLAKWPTGPVVVRSARLLAGAAVGAAITRGGRRALYLGRLRGFASGFLGYRAVVPQ